MYNRPEGDPDFDEWLRTSPSVVFGGPGQWGPPSGGDDDDDNGKFHRGHGHDPFHIHFVFPGLDHNQTGDTEDPLSFGFHMSDPQDIGQHFDEMFRSFDEMFRGMGLTGGSPFGQGE